MVPIAPHISVIVSRRPGAGDGETFRAPARKYWSAYVTSHHIFRVVIGIYNRGRSHMGQNEGRD